MRKKNRLQQCIFLGAFVSLWPAACLATEFIDEVGRKISLARPPKRIVSVAPNLTEILFALGLGDRIVGVSSYCQFPPEAKKKEKVGGYINPSLEKIVALQPDLVVGAADGDLKHFVDRLSALGVPVYIINPQDVAGVIRSTTRIGEVTFTRQAAESISRSMRARIQELAGKVEGRLRPRVVHVLSLDPMMVAGKGTFVDDLIFLAGGRNIAEGAVGRYPRFSMEEIIRRDPEIVFLSSMTSQDSMGGELQWWQRWRNMSAVRRGRIHVLDPDLIHRPSPRIIQGLEQMARLIHPEAFP